MTTPSPQQGPPQAHMPPPPFMPPPGGPVPPGGPPPTGGRPRRLGLILGISIPVAILLIGAIAAAIIVPQVLRQQQIDEAVAEHQQELADWEAAFSAERLAAVETAFEGLEFADASVSTAERCGQLSELGALHDQLVGVPAPQLTEIEGGDQDEHYADAASRQRANGDRYAAAGELVELLAAHGDTLAADCDYLAAHLEAAEARLAAASASDERAGRLAENDSYRIDIEDGYWEITCVDPNGCYDMRTADEREANARAWEQAYVVYAETMVSLIDQRCPVGLSEACEVESSYWTERIGFEQTVADTLRSDPRQQLEQHEQVDHDYLAARDALDEWYRSNPLSGSQTVSGQATQRFEDARSQIVRARDGALG